MKEYIDYLDKMTDPETGLIGGNHLSDWLSPELHRTEHHLLVTAQHAYNLKIMAQVAEILGKTDDANTFWDKYEVRKAFFNHTFVDPETKRTIKTNGELSDSQASYAVPLDFGVFDDETIPYAAKHLAEAVSRENADDTGKMRPEYSLMTGFIGTASISSALSDNGYDEAAYRLLQNTSYPSWLYSVENGATTIWERLNSYTVEDGFGGNNSMNSFNHYAFGAVGAWMYSHSLGIQRDEHDPGFKHFVLQPTPDPSGEMTWAKGHYDSMYGRIESAWNVENGIFTYNATVPANTTATVYIPTYSEHAVTEGGQSIEQAKGVTFVEFKDGKAVYELESGSYEFRSFIATSHNVAGLESLVELFETAGDFANDRVVHSLKLHLTAVARFEEQAAAEKVVKHLRGFKQLLDHQQENALVSESASNVLKTYADELIEQLVKEGANVKLTAEETEIHPGDHVQFEAVFENTSDDDIHDLNMSLTAPDGWEMTAETSPSTEVVKPGETFTAQFNAVVSKQQELTNSLTIEGEAVYHKFGEAVTLPLSMTAKVTSPIRIQETQADPVEPGEETTLHVTVKNNAQQSFAGNITVEAPADWTVEPATQPYELDPGTEETLAFTVAVPEDAVRGAELRVSATYEDYTADETTTSVRLPGVSWEFDTDGDAQGWHPENQLTEFTVSDGVLTTQSTGGDPFMVQQEPLSLDASHGAVIQLTMKTSVSSGGQIFWGTEASPHFSEDKSVRFEVKSGDFNVYQVSIPPQDSPITTLRIDPLTQEGNITIKSIHLFR